MRTPKVRIPYKYGETIYIKPVFDLHLSAAACDVKACKDFLADSDENTYFILGGDTFDSIVVTDKRYRKSGDTTVGEAILDDMVDLGVEIFEPYKEKILGVMHGNHEDTVLVRSGTCLISRLCRRLGVEDIGYSGLMRLQLHENGSRIRKVMIRYHHGWGGGSRTIGGNLTKYSKDLAYWQSDVFLYGHGHDRKADSIPRLGMTGEKLTSKPKILCLCGTFLKTYTTGKSPTYSEKMGYPPLELGGVVIEIKPRAHWVKLKARLD